jgi:hypothetical protein
MQMQTVDRLFSISVGFNLLGLGRTKGYAEIANGRLKIVRNGRRTFVRASELQRYVDVLETNLQQQAA